MKQGNQNPQNNMIAAFLSPERANVTQGSIIYLCGQRFSLNDQILMPQQAKNTANDLTRFQHEAGWLHTSLSFLSQTANCSRQFSPNGSNFAKNVQKNATVPRRRTWSISWHLAPFANRQKLLSSLTHKNTLSSSRVITKITHSWPWWIPPQALKDICFSPRLSCPSFLAEPACWIDRFTSIPECPELKKRNRLRKSTILHPTDFG